MEKIHIIGFKLTFPTTSLPLLVFEDLTFNDQFIRQANKYSKTFNVNFRLTYQLKWKNIHRDASINFPSHFEYQELLPFIPDNRHKHRFNLISETYPHKIILQLNLTPPVLIIISPYLIP